MDQIKIGGFIAEERKRQFLNGNGETDFLKYHF